jgi:secreted trypsin-like serine protease
MRSSVLALLMAAGCSGGLPTVGSQQENLIGATVDTADPSVVLLFQSTPGQPGGALCTGEVISPHVVLTAAHCTGGEDPAAAASSVWQVFLGADFNKATQTDLLPVKEVHFNQAFNPKDLFGGNDVGVAILQNPLPSSIVPLKVNHTAIDPSQDGQPVRFVGYGLSSATVLPDGTQNGSGAGVKRQTSTTLSGHDNLLLKFTDGTHETCNGDSGGPAFMTIGGQEVIVGVTSFGDLSCSGGGYDTRIDVFTSFIDPFVQNADPGFSTAPTGNKNPAPPSSAAGGTQAPPGSTTAPPSSASTAGVGATCARDSDCQSGVCGLDDHGGHMCYAASANGGSGGCAVGGDGSGGLGVVLLFGLALKLGRARRRARR